LTYNIFMIGWQQFIEALNTKEGIDLSYSDWKTNIFLQLFDVAPSTNLNSGSLQFELTFDKELEKALIMIILTQKEGVLEIDAHGNIRSGENEILK